MSETKKTLIEEGTELKGTLTSTCPIVVHGARRGRDDRPVGRGHRERRAVRQGQGDRAALARRAGGRVRRRQVVELSGRVRDKTIIRAQSLEVSLKRDEGRIEMVFGDCELAVGDAPDKAKAIANAMSNGHKKAKKPDEPAPTPPAETPPDA